MEPHASVLYQVIFVTPSLRCSAAWRQASAHAARHFSGRRRDCFALTMSWPAICAWNALPEKTPAGTSTSYMACCILCALDGERWPRPVPAKARPTVLLLSSSVTMDAALMRRLLGISVAVAAASSPSTTAAAPVSVSIDATAKPSPFEHRWKRSFGSGHSSLTLRPDWRSHYQRAVKELGLGGVRYHGLFDDDMGPVVPAPGRYNFSLVDSTWDFLRRQGSHPVVELSFMPAFVANCTWHGHCKQDRIGCEGYWCTQCSGHGVGPVVNAEAPEQCHALEFWYQGIKQVPYQKDYTPWFALVKTTAQHAVDRYGLAEVQQWSFEVWNELWGLSFPEDYVWPARLDLDGYRPIPAARPAWPAFVCLLTQRFL